MSNGKIITLRLAHSPDPDDVFMWWPLLEIDGAEPAIDPGRFRFESVLGDIESLNERAERGDYEITAVSCAHYPRVKDRYMLTACGASIGENYGPKLVARDARTIEQLRQRHPLRIAVPGLRTTAFTAASLLLGPGAFEPIAIAFDEIPQRVATGEFDAGVVIHEGQLTVERDGLHEICDLGEWWMRTRHLPLPLGANAVRRDLDEVLGEGTLRDVADLLQRSVQHALDHREQGLRIALQHARGLSADEADRFVGMYVNRWSLDFGPTGRAALERFLTEAHEAGLLPPPGAIDFVPAGAGAGTAR